MVAGGLKKPWAGPGRLLRFGEDVWASWNPSSEWSEHEVAAGDSPVFRRLFAGKARADTPDTDDEEYLFSEEVGPDGSSVADKDADRIGPLPADVTEVSTGKEPQFNLTPFSFFELYAAKLLRCFPGK